MYRRRRIDFNNYHRKYGSTRQIRAERMFLNQAPLGLALPPVAEVPIQIAAYNSVASFTNDHRYIEELFVGGFLKPNLNNRRFIVVRSQKYVHPTNEVYYFLHLPNNLLLGDISNNGNGTHRRNIANYIRFARCECRDFTTQHRMDWQCKHKLLLQYSLQGNTRNLRRY